MPLMLHVDLKVDKFSNSYCGVSALVGQIFLTSMQIAPGYQNRSAVSWTPSDALTWFTASPLRRIAYSVTLQLGAQHSIAIKPHTSTSNTSRNGTTRMSVTEGNDRLSRCEHEFWFLVICEQYTDGFSPRLTSVTSGGSHVVAGTYRSKSVT